MVRVTNKIAATLTFETKEGKVYYIPPRVRDMKVDVDSANIVNSACQLIITEEVQPSKKRGKRRG